MDETLIGLFHRFAGLAFDREQRFLEYVAQKAPGEKRSLEVETGVLSYGPKLKFEALLVGVHADHNDSWMWTWANRTMKMSVTNRALGDTIRALAHRTMSPVFAKPAFPLELVIGPEFTPQATLFFAAVLLGELDYDAYFVAKHDGNPALFLIRDERLRTTEKYPLARILSLFPKLIAAMPVTDHRTVFENYVQSYGLTTTPDGSNLKVAAGAGELIASFDSSGKFKKLDGLNIPAPKSRPAAPARKKTVAPVKKLKPKAKPAAKIQPKKKPAPKPKPKPKPKSKRS